MRSRCARSAHARWRALASRARAAFASPGCLGSGEALPENRSPSGEGSAGRGPQAEAERPEVAHGAEDDLGPGAGRAAGDARIVGHAHFFDAPAPGTQLDQQLRGEERAARFHRHALQCAPREQLAGAVDVADLQPEEDAVGEAIRAGVQRPDERVGAPDAVADDRIGGAGLEPFDEPPEVRETWPVGDGVRVPGSLDDCPLVCGVGVKIDGTDELLPVQAETVMARRTAPAAERPAISHALWAATGWVRRIFMNPPRMRVR